MSCKLFLSVLLSLLVVPCLPAGDGIGSTPRDTGPMPEHMVTKRSFEAAYVLVHETPFIRLYFREDRGILALQDRRNGYIWTSGLDLPFNTDIQDQVDRGVNPLVLPPLEDRLNSTFIGIANSLISLEYFDSANNIRRAGGSAQQGVRRQFSVTGRNPWKATVLHDFTDLKIQLRLELELVDDTLIFRVPDAGLSGEGLSRLASINLAPFLGASGGRQRFWDPALKDFGPGVPKAAPSGYVVVPDGSGALIRFVDNSTRLAEYQQPIYGTDLGQAALYRSSADFSPLPKQAFLPLFGIVHGGHQNAFAAYAVSGSEYLEITAYPEENLTFYTHAYPRFVYNRLFYQVYNQRGDGYYKLLPERNAFDLEMHYRFLEGSEPDAQSGPSADYAGIALAYRAHLESRQLLPARSTSTAAGKPVNIPLRLDFLMADVSKSIVGHAHQLVTTIDDVEVIVEDILAMGMDNLSVGLLGYNRGGTILSTPGAVNLYRPLGNRQAFSRAIERLTTQGIDVSFGRDFGLIAEGQVLPWGKALRGASGWYLNFHTYQANAPVNRFYFPKVEIALAWLLREARAQLSLGASSVTVDGLGYRLYSDYPARDPVSRSRAKQLLVDAFAQLSAEAGLNLVQPNQYLWRYTRRFLAMPVFSSQYLIQTDTVPLLQLVLQGTMDLFAPYSNFSFSSTQDILRMIDYNVYPSFILTRQSSHELLMTNSAYLYSTQYDNFRDLIPRVYGPVNLALRHVLDARWLHRRVLAPGVVLNQYDNGVSIIVNYRKTAHLHGTVSVPPEAAAVIGPDGGVL